MNWLAALTTAAVALAGSIAPAGAVELIVYSSTGMQAALTDIQAIYEHKTHNKLAMTFLTANQVKDKIDAGAAFDVAIVLPPVTDQLIAAGKIEAGIVPLAKSGLGI